MRLFGCGVWADDAAAVRSTWLADIGDAPGFGPIRVPPGWVLTITASAVATAPRPRHSTTQRALLQRGGFISASRRALAS